MTYKRLTTLLAVIAGLTSMTAATYAGDDSSDFQADLTFGYQTGDYGTTFDTDVYSLTTRLRWLFHRGEIRVSVPYLQLESEGSVQIIGGRPTDTARVPGAPDLPGLPGPGGPSTTESSTSGIGDAKIRGEYFVVDSGPTVALVGEIKAPTADEQEGLGTGEMDYTGGAGLVLPLGRTNLLADASFTKMGDVQGYDFEDVFAIGSGLAWKLGERGQLFVYAENRSSPVTGEDDRADVAVGASKKFSSSFRLAGTLMVGLSDSAEDFGAALSFGRVF